MVATFPFEASLELNKLPVYNLVIEPVGTLPAATSADAGRLVTYQGDLYISDGASWFKPEASSADTATNANHATTADSATTAATATNANQLGGQTLAQVRDFAQTTGQRPSTAISDFATQAQTAAQANRLDQFAAPINPVNFNSQRLTAVGTPTTGTDGANKAYVDTSIANVQAGLDPKEDVAVVVTTNVTKSGLTTHDGYTLQAGDRVLQAVAPDHLQNGVWIASAGSWTHKTPQEEQPGAFWFVRNGTLNRATQWICRNSTTPVWGTDPVEIGQFGAQISYTGTNGVQVVGSTISAVALAGGGISTAGGIAVDATVSRTYTVAIPAPGSGTAVTITSPVVPAAGRRLSVQVYRNSDNKQVGVSIQNAPGSASVTIDFGVAPAPGAYSAEIRS